MPVSIRLPEELRAELKRLAAEDGRSMSNLMLKALREWVAAQHGQGHNFIIDGTRALAETARLALGRPRAA